MPTFYERWEDLLSASAAVATDDPYAHLSEKQLADLAMLARMVRLLDAGKGDASGSMARNADRMREAFLREGLDSDWLLSQREAVRQLRMLRSRNPEADGRPVRLLGMVAPLSWDENIGVSDFLLTATMGSCSHVPPPPHHQVAQIRTLEPIDVFSMTRKQGTPDPWVWVEGTIRFGVSTHSLFRGDGYLRIEAGYSIELERIVPASGNELDLQVEYARQQAEAIHWPSQTI